jgi:hypothetical protein
VPIYSGTSFCLTCTTSKSGDGLGLAPDTVHVVGSVAFVGPHYCKVCSIPAKKTSQDGMFFFYHFGGMWSYHYFGNGTLAEAWETGCFKASLLFPFQDVFEGSERFFQRGGTPAHCHLSHD